MNQFRFNKNKNKLLKLKRGIGFQEIIKKIETGNVIKVIKNPNKKRYPNQKMYLIKMKNHVIVVPYIEGTEYIFLKTFFPSQKYTKELLKIKYEYHEKTKKVSV